MTQLLAYKSDPALKKMLFTELTKHRKADEIIKGVYWDNGKGCAVGCSIHTLNVKLNKSYSPRDYDAYQTELGIPWQLALLEYTIFEELPNDKAKLWPERFTKSITPGTDLTKITAQLIMWQWEDTKYGLKNIQEVKDDKKVYRWCEEVTALYTRILNDETVSEKEFRVLLEKTDAGTGAGERTWAGTWAGAWAWAGARTWAGAGTWAGAWIWAGAWAWAGTWAGTGAWAGTWAGRGAGAGAYEILADKLIELLENAPVIKP